MRKSYKIILFFIFFCVCVVLVFAMLGFGIFRRMTDTIFATDSNQNINATNTESGIEDSSHNINIDDIETNGDGIKIRGLDGSEWTIIADPSVVGDDFDWGNYDVGITGNHE